MIPAFITKNHIAEAILCITRDGIPPRRKGRGYCLVTNGNHFPPKFTITSAHEIATGEPLPSNRFSGGQESNEFLRCRGFDVTKCSCGGSVSHGRFVAEPNPPVRRKRIVAPRRHSERCADCKLQVARLLERIYGICVRNQGFRWQVGLAPYSATAIGPTLREVARRLKAYRGFSVDEFVRSKMLAGCDYWVPNPGFIVEFDESQHFTIPRKLALSVYADKDYLGFSARRWMELCEHHLARDNNPPDRDEQRAWYDTLRDLIPSIMGLQPTARLFGRDEVWCSLDPNSSKDRERFFDLLHGKRSGSSLTMTMVSRPTSVQPKSILRVAMVFPQVGKRSLGGVPPTGTEAQEPDLPMATSFAGESIDFVLFPEGYICASDQERVNSLKELASDPRAPLLVGATDRSVSPTGRTGQVILRFDPDGSYSRVYIKHSTANAVAFVRPDWKPNSSLPTFQLGSVTVGATICHDHYLGLLPRFLARRGARLWVNPSYDNVIDIKWSSVLRLRAVENRFFAICTLHCDETGGRTHPFAFAPDGSELVARKAGSEIVQPMSECCEAGNVYIIDLNMAAVTKPVDWRKLPLAGKPKRPRNGKNFDSSYLVQTVHGPVFVGIVPGEQILDAAECFRVIDCASQLNCAPMIWNHWDRLPADSARLATFVMGRAIECCAPIVISDRTGIHELVELSNRNKVPARRDMEASGDAIVDIGYAWGRDNAFKIVTKHLPAGKRKRALDQYRSLV